MRMQEKAMEVAFDWVEGIKPVVCTGSLFQNEIEIWSAERATSENAFLSPKHRLASGK